MRKKGQINQLVSFSFSSPSSSPFPYFLFHIPNYLFSFSFPISPPPFYFLFPYVLMSKAYFKRNIKFRTHQKVLSLLHQLLLSWSVSQVTSHFILTFFFFFLIFRTDFKLFIFCEHYIMVIRLPNMHFPNYL